MKLKCPCDSCKAKRKLDRQASPRHGSKATKPVKMAHFDRVDRAAQARRAKQTCQRDADTLTAAVQATPDVVPEA